MYYNEVSVENEIILGIYAEKGPYNMTMWYTWLWLTRMCMKILTDIPTSLDGTFAGPA